jgi:hypothetical protein
MFVRLLLLRLDVFRTILLKKFSLKKSKRLDSPPQV